MGWVIDSLEPFAAYFAEEHCTRTLSALLRIQQAAVKNNQIYYELKVTKNTKGELFQKNLTYDKERHLFMPL